MTHVNIVFCTPGHSLMAGYVKSLIKTTDELNKRGISWAFSNDYSSHVADARELTLSGFRQNIINEQRPFHGQMTYDKLMWIDSDIIWEPEDVLRLYESDKDVISGAYILGNGEVTAYKRLFGPGYNWEEVKNMTEPEQVYGVGFGFVCIKQGVFEKMTRPWFQSAIVTHYNEDGSEYKFPLMGEDLSWCYRAKEYGFDIWFDPTVRVTHHKTMKLTWEGPMP